MPTGGVGNSWFEVELSSLDVPYLGGVGYSWFEISLTSEHVDDGDVVVITPPGGGVTPTRPKRKRHIRIEDRFDGLYSVVETRKDQFGGRLIVFKPARFAGTLAVVQSSTQSFSASYDASILRARQREEEEFLFLTDDE